MKREHAYKLRELMHKAAVSLGDEDALEAVELFPAWAVGVAYAADERIRCGEKLYRSSPASGSFQMSQFFILGGQSIGVSTSTSILTMNTQD